MRQLNVAARRANPTAFYAMLSAIQSSLFLDVLALNQAYVPTYKWMADSLNSMAPAPRQLSSQLRRMFRAPPLQAVRQLRQVLQQPLMLVEAQYPERDTAFARYGVDQTPTAYERRA